MSVNHAHKAAGPAQPVAATSGSTHPARAPLPGYNWRQTYDWNFDQVPAPEATAPAPPLPGAWTYAGLAAGSPLSIAAGPLLNGRWILYYASLGFDVLTYKTVRSGARASYPLPNLQPVISPHPNASQPIPAADTMHGSWAVSFGMPSKDPEFWRRDIEAARSALAASKILSVSVVASPQPSWSPEELAADFVRCARWAIDAGAHCIEANFSCPNVASADGQLFQQPQTAAMVAAALKQAIGAIPLLLKIGHLTEAEHAEALIAAVAPHADALVVVNCVPARVAGPGGRLLFDGQARGLAGEVIRTACLEQMRLFGRLLRQRRLPLRLIGVGGISQPGHMDAAFEAGCEAVQLATAAMIDPLLGLRLRDHLAARTERNRAVQR
jgi:dihydroorotate dehydrogenase